MRTFDIHVFVLVTPGTDVFYNRASTGDRVPAIVLGSSPQPGYFLRIQYEFGGKVRKILGVPAGGTKGGIRETWTYENH